MSLHPNFPVTTCTQQWSLRFFLLTAMINYMVGTCLVFQSELDCNSNSHTPEAGVVSLATLIILLSMNFPLIPKKKRKNTSISCYKILNPKRRQMLLFWIDIKLLASLKHLGMMMEWDDGNGCHSASTHSLWTLEDFYFPKKHNFPFSH